jgi:tRNA A-37 threonylcarbamoyl transferase component Bud32
MLLSARPFRSVSLDRDRDPPVVVKRFHHHAALAGLFDRARARREFAALSALAAASVSVPRPLGVERSPAGWELRLAAVPGARSLAELLEESAIPGGWDVLARRLARLLADLQRSGWEHGDLHPGNVLVDGAGEPWLIDLQRARRRVPDRARALDEVVACAGHVREFLPRRVRLRFLRAWLAALPAELRPHSRGRELVRALEERARVFRRESVRAHLGRWLRPSSRLVAAEHDGRRVLVRRDRAAQSIAKLRAAADYVLSGSEAEIRPLWLGAARLVEHGLACLRPTLYAPGSTWRRQAWAAFERAEAATPGAIRARLADRGLRLHTLALEPAPEGARILPPPEHSIEAL